MEDRTTLRVQLVTALVALVGSLGAAFLTSQYALKSAQAEIDKDRMVLSASNAHENAKAIRERAEQYLVSLMELMHFLDNTRVDINEAAKRIDKMNQLAQGLLVYGGGELGSASMKVNLAIEEALISLSKKELKADLDAVRKSVEEWYTAFFSVIKSYDRHTMPVKNKMDLQNELMETVLRGFNK